MFAGFRHKTTVVIGMLNRLLCPSANIDTSMDDGGGPKQITEKNNSGKLSGKTIIFPGVLEHLKETAARTFKELPNTRTS